MGTAMGEPEPAAARATPPEGEIGRTLFVYRGPDRQPLFYIVRPAPEAPDAAPVPWGPVPGGRGWAPGLGHVARPWPLYRLGALEADPAAPVVFHLDERDVYRATMAGLAGVHTTTVLGPRHVEATDLGPLLGRDVAVVVQDTGEGAAYAGELAARARVAGARRVVTVRLDEPAPGAGAEAWLHAGGTPADWAAALGEAGLAAQRPSADPLAPLARLTGTAPASEPAPLPTGAAAPAPFDPGLLPEPLLPLVEAAAALGGCAPEYPAVAAMAALAAVTGRALRVRPDPEVPQSVVPNLWAALVTDGTAVRPAAAVGAVLAALDALEAEAHDDFARAQAAWRARRAAYRTAVQAWRRRVRESPPERHALGALAAVYPHPPVRPERRRHQTATARIDSLVRLLNGSPAGLLLRVDDLGTWVRALARTGHEGERDFLLRCWEGAAPGLDYDGPEGASLHCVHPCLSVLGWIPAEAWRRLPAHGEAGTPAAELLGHFSLAVYPEAPAGTAPDPARAADVERARGRVLRVLERLGALARPAGPLPPPPMAFTPAAAAHAARWHAALEGSADGASGPLAVHLAGQRKAMPALALLIHLAERADRDEAPDAVPLAAAERATAWCDLLIGHVRRLHGAEAPAVDGARALLDRLAAGELRSPFTVRDVYRRHWSGLGDPEAARAAVALLERHAWLAAEPVPTTAKGGKPTRRYHVHPAVRPDGAEVALRS